MRDDIFNEARKIVGIFPITNSDIHHYISKGKDNDTSILEAVNDFLKLELKLDEEKIKELKIMNVTRPQKEEADRLYLHLKEEEGAKYLYRKVAQVKNSEVK